MMKWEINYYFNEVAFKAGGSAFRETVNGDRNFAISIANNKINHSTYKFYDIKKI